MGSGSPGQPVPDARPPLRGNDGGFFLGKDADGQFVAVMRDLLGDEAAERMLRSRELSGHPRPLTNGERLVMRETAPGGIGEGIWTCLQGGRLIWEIGEVGR